MERLLPFFPLWCHHTLPNLWITGKVRNTERSLCVASDANGLKDRELTLDRDVECGRSNNYSNGGERCLF